MYRIGLDVHWKTTSVCILDDNGKLVKEKTLKGSFTVTVDYLRRFLTGPAEVVFEATGHYGFLYDSLRAISTIRRIVMAHPGGLRLIWGSKRKNDRIDAQKLAKLLYLDMVPTAYVPSKANREWRELIEYRQATVASVVRCKNTIRALLRRQGLAAPTGLWSKKGLVWLATVAMDEASDFQREMQLDELTTQLRRLKKVTRRLDVRGRQNPAVRLLQTIPGIGPRTSEAMVAYVADPQRFATSRSAGTYFGMVPCQDESAGKARFGHITKQGPATVRQLLVEASWQVIRRSPTMRKVFERACHGRKDRRKIALVATARQLACRMVAMLKTGEVWREAA